jgi:hypothetical protein
MIDSDLDELLNLVDNKDVIRHEKKEFNDQFKKDLENDYNILKDLYTQWSLVKQDPKIDKLKQYLS